MSVNKEDTLRQFCDVTGADETRSRFFLESSNWQLEVALSSFYEHGGNADEVSGNPSVAPASLPTLSDSDMESPPGSPLRAKKKEKKKTNTRFATLGSLQQESSSDEEEDKELSRKLKMQTYFCDEASCSKSEPKKQHMECNENSPDMDSLQRELERLKKENRGLRREVARLRGMQDENDKGQAFYAGGSERSGQQIIGPGKRKDIVTEMFKSVRERGAVVFEDEPSTASRGRGAFSGVGYRLGQTSDDHEEVTPTNTQQPGAARSVRLRLYREGFTVDNGALRHYTDPENADFLSCIRRGEIPPELSDGGGEVRVSLEDRRHEECPRQGSKPSLFTGKGHLLGSPTPPVVGGPPAAAGAPVSAEAPVSAGASAAAVKEAAQSAVGLDESKPVTTVQFRLADGSRLTGRFNHSHTVRDLAQYVSAAGAAPSPFALLAGYPSAELADPRATLAQANLLNATVLQRLK